MADDELDETSNGHDNPSDLAQNALDKLEAKILAVEREIETTGTEIDKLETKQSATSAGLSPAEETRLTRLTQKEQALRQEKQALRHEKQALQTSLTQNEQALQKEKQTLLEIQLKQLSINSQSSSSKGKSS